jgi:hypothetical protein
MSIMLKDVPVMVGSWDFKAPMTSEQAKVVQSLTAVNHYIYVVMEDAEKRGLDLIVIKKCLGVQFNTSQVRIHGRYTNAKKYIESGKLHRPYAHGVPETFEEFKEKHFIHCQLGEDSHSITDGRNEVYIIVTEALAHGVHFNDSLNKLAEARNTSRGSIRESFQSAVDYYIGLANSPLFSRYYDVEQHGKPTGLSVGAPSTIPQTARTEVPDVRNIVKQLTGGTRTSLSIDPILGGVLPNHLVTRDNAPVSEDPHGELKKSDGIVDLVSEIISDRDHHKSEALKYKADSEKYQSEAEHYKNEYVKLSEEMTNLKTLLERAAHKN